MTGRRPADVVNRDSLVFEAETVDGATLSRLARARRRWNRVGVERKTAGGAVDFYVIAPPGFDDPGVHQTLAGARLLQVASCSEHARWGVFLADAPLPPHPLIGPLPADCETLARAALRHAPLLALARDDVLDARLEAESLGGLLSTWSSALSARLGSGELEGYRMRRSTIDFGPDLRRGREYWVLDPWPGDGAGQVRWVTADYRVCRAAASCFSWTDRGGDEPEESGADQSARV
jgi:hypothetical protein